MAGLGCRSTAQPHTGKVSITPVVLFAGPAVPTARRTTVGSGSYAVELGRSRHRVDLVGTSHRRNHGALARRRVVPMR